MYETLNKNKRKQKIYKYNVIKSINKNDSYQSH